MKQVTLPNRFVALAAVCFATALPLVAQARPDHVANHEAKMEKKAANAAGKAAHRAANHRTDADKVVDALSEPEKKVFHDMSTTEKSVARHMAHIAKQIL